MSVAANSLPLLSSLAVGLALTLACEPGLNLWDELALRRVRECIALGRTVGISERSVRAGMRVWGLVLFGSPLVVWSVFGSVVLVPIAAWLIFQAPRWILGMIIRRLRDRLRDQLVPVCFALANTVRAGLSLAQGIKLAGREAPEPIRGELLRIVQDYSRGRSLAQAIGDTAERLDLNGFRMFAAALLSCLEHGGPITDTLDGLALAVQENQRLELKMDTETAGGRISLWLMGFFPVVFLALNFLIEPTSTRLLLSTIPGQVLLTVMIILDVLSVRLGLRISAIEGAI
jgi:tight adherence protein B